MKRNILGIVAVVMGLAVALPASAAEADKRQVSEQQRINQGVRSGELTGREAVRLERQHRAINREIRRDRRDDGHLDAAERAKINHDQNALSRRIARQKHDGQSR
jgi:IS30 family transposase